MQNSSLKCPSCQSSEMISGGLHGMDHNVCTKCGTVLENEQYTVDVYEGGCKEVKADYSGRPFNYGFLFSKSNYQHSKNHRDGLVMLRRLMDGLDLPTSVRDTAMDYFKHTKSLNKIASAGAVVYLAMKDFRMPVTIRCIANYLQVSHFTIGRVMRTLEKKLEHKRTHSPSFEVNELIPHLFSQAKFGVEETKKQMLDLLMLKTDQLLCLLKECMATTGYVPHLIALSAGYIVWKHLNITKWRELNLEVDKLAIRPVHYLTISVFLSEIGIVLPSQGHLAVKIALIKNVLYNLCKQIPWLSNIEPESVVLHLHDILTYKSQIIHMTAIEMSKEDSEKDVLISKEEDMNSINQPENSSDIPGSSVIIASNSFVENSPPSCYDSVQNYVAKDNFAKKVDESSVQSSVKRNAFIRVMDLKFASEDSLKEAKKSSNCKRKSELSEEDESESNGYNKLLLLSHPNLGKRKKKKKRQDLAVHSFLSCP